MHVHANQCDYNQRQIEPICTYQIYELSLGTNLINNNLNDCLHFGQLLWPSSGRKVYIAEIYILVEGV